MRRVTRLQKSRGLVATASLVFLAGCSSQQIYESSQGWRQSECGKIVDAAKSEACLREANKPYDAYEEQRRAVQKP